MIAVRAAVVVHRERDYLLNRTETPSGVVYTLMGGHLEEGESAVACLEREFMEELGWPLRVGPLLWVVENRWAEDDPADSRAGRQVQEICLVFYGEVPHDLAAGDPATTEGHLWPGWHSEGDVKSDGRVEPAVLEEPLFRGHAEGYSGPVAHFVEGL